MAANRTPNRMGIRMENRTCRRPLNEVRTSDGKIFPDAIANITSEILQMKYVQHELDVGMIDSRDDSFTCYI
jgi:hypothetical protein